MKILRENVLEYGACGTGIELSDELNVWGKDSKEIIKLFIDIDRKELAEWVISYVNSAHGKKHRGDYKYLRYLVYNPKMIAYHPKSTIEEVKEVIENLKNSLDPEDLKFIYVMEELLDNNGKIHRIGPIEI